MPQSSKNLHKNQLDKQEKFHKLAFRAIMSKSLWRRLVSTLFKVWFLRDTDLFRVQIRQVLLYNLYKLNTCLFQTQKQVTRRFGLDRDHCIKVKVHCSLIPPEKDVLIVVTSKTNKNFPMVPKYFYQEFQILSLFTIKPSISINLALEQSQGVH